MATNQCKSTLSITTALLLVAIGCSNPSKQDNIHSSSPAIIESQGFVVLTDTMAKPTMHIIEESNLNKVKVGNPEIVPAVTNVYPAGKPRVVTAGKPRTCTPGQDTFLLPTKVLAIDSLLIAGRPEIIEVREAYTKDENPQNFSSYSKLQGLKSEEIRSMLHDRSGNLWLANTGGGVCKYDGKSFTHFTEADGLSSSYIMDILEDRQGNIWLATHYGGVCKYDGVSFTHFTTNDGLPFNEINCILEDHDGHLWFGSVGGGISKYDGQSFTNYTMRQGLSHNIVLRLYEDLDSNLWIGTDGGGVNKFDGTSFIHYTEKEGLSNNTVSSIVQDPYGNFWFGTDGGGVNKYDGKSFTHFTDKEGLTHNAIVNSMIDDNGHLWFATFGGGVNKYDGKSFTHLTEKEGLSDNIVWDILEDRGRNVWFATANGGVNKYDGKSFTHFTVNEGLVHNFISYVYEDRSGNIWLGTFGGGVSKYDGKSFTHFTEKDGLSFSTVQCILEDRNGNLWFGTDIGGVNKYDGTSFTHYTVKDGLSHYSVTSILEDRLGNIWFGTAGGGVNKYDGNRVEAVERGARIPLGHQQDLTKVNGKLVKTFTAFTEDQGLNSNHISCLWEDRLGNIWIGSFTGGVTKYNGNRVAAIERGDLIPAAEYQDLQKSNGKPVASFTHFTEQEGLSNNYVSGIVEDKYGNLWFATNAGVSRYDGSAFTHFTEQDGLSNNTVKSMLQDRRGNIWLGTNAGLSLLTKVKLDSLQTRFERARHDSESSDEVNKRNDNSLQDHHVHFKNYKFEDGFLSLVCNRNSIREDNKGNIWIGTNDRLTVYHPESETSYTTAPNMQLTGVQLYNESIDWSGLEDHTDTTFLLGNGIKAGPFRFDNLSRWYSLPQHLSLSHRNNNVTFTYIGITMHQPQKVRYQYKLEGNDKQWSAATYNTAAPYGNLPHGQYTFKVKAMNSDGIWSNEFEYPLTIRTPWWRTWWAYLIYACSLVWFFMFIRQREIQKRELEYKLEIERVASEKLKEVDQLKSKFFANISHEFRTPLTLMLGQLESIDRTISDEFIRKKTDMATRNGYQLMELISQVLDLSKLEAGRMELHLRSLDLIAFAHDAVQPFYLLARERNVALEIESTFAALQIPFDHEKMTRVINNLLANALKFTPPGGSIQIKIDKTTAESKLTQPSGHTEGVTGEMAVITVSDTGIGISADNIDRVFDRFYRIENSAMTDTGGTGIGLAIVRELVHLHGGTVSVSSEHGKGTSFRVSLPMQAEVNIVPAESKTPETSWVGHSTTKTPNVEAITDMMTGKELSSSNVGDNATDQPMILVVEDHPDMRRFISEQLQEAGYQTAEAGDGEQGLAAALTVMPELIITDIMMPRMDGLEFSKRLRSDVRVSHIPVIMLTARAGEEERIEGLLTGVDDYLTKPFSTRELHVRVANLLRIRQILRDRFSTSTVIRPAEVSVVPMDQAFLDNVLTTVEANIGEENFGVEALSEAVFMSTNHLHRKLTALINQSPGQLIRSMRLQRAADLLLAHAGTVNEIAYQVGYTVPENFSRSFKKQFGVSPLEYARNGARQN